MKKVLIGIAIVFGVVDIVVLGLLLNNAIANNDLKNYTIEELSNENENLKKQLKTLKQELSKFKEENNEKEIKENNEPIEEIKNLTLGNYDITIKEIKSNDGKISYRMGTIKNTKTNKTWDILGMDENGDIFAVTGTNKGIYNKKEGYVIEPKYKDVSCYFHSDESYYVCDNSYTTIVDESKLMSLKTGKIIVEADEIREISTGNFIAKKGNKRVLYTSDGKELLKKDYIGYISLYDKEIKKYADIGYITFDNNTVKTYSNNLKDIKLNIDKDKIYDVFDESRAWTSEDVLLNVDIKNNKYFKYTGNKYTGYQYVFIENPCYRDSLAIYVIDNNRLVKMDGITLIEESEIISCF